MFLQNDQDEYHNHYSPEYTGLERRYVNTSPIQRYSFADGATAPFPPPFVPKWGPPRFSDPNNIIIQIQPLSQYTTSLQPYLFLCTARSIGLFKATLSLYFEAHTWISQTFDTYASYGKIACKYFTQIRRFFGCVKVSSTYYKRAPGQSTHLSSLSATIQGELAHAKSSILACAFGSLIILMTDESNPSCSSSCRYVNWIFSRSAGLLCPNVNFTKPIRKTKEPPKWDCHCHFPVNYPSDMATVSIIGCII